MLPACKAGVDSDWGLGFLPFLSRTGFRGGEGAEPGGQGFFLRFFRVFRAAQNTTAPARFLPGLWNIPWRRPTFPRKYTQYHGR